MTNIRIIAGQFGSRSITSPSGSRTHPMGERIRGSLFNILGDISGKTVLVTGAGPIGLLAIGVARVFGATKIFVSDLSDYHLEIAKKNGSRCCS